MKVYRAFVSFFTERNFRYWTYDYNLLIFYIIPDFTNKNDILI